MAARLRAHMDFLISATAILTIGALPLVVSNSYVLDVLIRVALNGLVAIGLNLLIGYAGQISLGHAGFLGLGAYGSGILTMRYGWPPLAALAFCTAMTWGLAWGIARPVLRLNGHYLAMATLGIGLVISIAINTEAQLTGGPDGMSVDPFRLFGWMPRGEEAWFRIAWLLLLLGLVLSRNIARSPAGRALRMIETAEIAAQVSGIDTMRYKVNIFALSAALASFVGGLTAYYVGFITPSLGGIFHSIELITIVVVGGAGTTLGPLLGSVLVTILPQLLSRFEGYEVMAFGALLTLTLLFLPHGLTSLSGMLRARA